MPSFPIIAIIACVAYGIESIFGFGGTIIFLGLSGLFYDFNSLLKLAMIVGLSSGLAVLIQSFKFLSWEHLIRILLFTIPGATLGTILISYLTSELLIKFFSLILILYGGINLFFPKLEISKSIKKILIVLGGFIQGIYTVGGPFVLMGYKDSFASKEQLRSTMAGYFFIINSFRVILFIALGGSYKETILTYYPIGVMVMLSVWLAYPIHKRIPENLFKKLIIVFIIFIGIIILLTK